MPKLIPPKQLHSSEMQIGINKVQQIEKIYTAISSSVSLHTKTEACKKVHLAINKYTSRH